MVVNDVKGITSFVVFKREISLEIGLPHIVRIWLDEALIRCCGGARLLGNATVAFEDGIDCTGTGDTVKSIVGEHTVQFDRSDGGVIPPIADDSVFSFRRRPVWGFEGSLTAILKALAVKVTFNPLVAGGAADAVLAA